LQFFAGLLVSYHYVSIRKKFGFVNRAEPEAGFFLEDQYRFGGAFSLGGLSAYVAVLPDNEQSKKYNKYGQTGAVLFHRMVSYR